MFNTYQSGQQKVLNLRRKGAQRSPLPAGCRLSPGRFSRSPARPAREGTGTEPARFPRLLRGRECGVSPLERSGGRGGGGRAGLRLLRLRAGPHPPAGG